MAYPSAPMNRKSSYIRMDLFVRCNTEHFLKHKASRKVILLLDGCRACCDSLLLLQSAAENNGTAIRLPSHCTYTLELLFKKKGVPQLLKSFDIAWRAHWVSVE